MRQYCGMMLVEFKLLKAGCAALSRPTLQARSQVRLGNELKIYDSSFALLTYGYLFD